MEKTVQNVTAKNCTERPGRNGQNQAETSTPERVMALYESGAFASWSELAKALRLPGRGSAYSLAHGLRKPDPATVRWLEVIEFRAVLPQAVANLEKLIGNGDPGWPDSFSRAEARAILKKRRRIVVRASGAGGRDGLGYRRRQ